MLQVGQFVRTLQMMRKKTCPRYISPNLVPRAFSLKVGRAGKEKEKEKPWERGCMSPQYASSLVVYLLHKIHYTKAREEGRIVGRISAIFHLVLHPPGCFISNLANIIQFFFMLRLFLRGMVRGKEVHIRPFSNQILSCDNLWDF